LHILTKQVHEINGLACLRTHEGHAQTRMKGNNRAITYRGNMKWKAFSKRLCQD